MCKKQTSVSHGSTSLWMLDCAWMDYLLLIFGTRCLKYYFQITLQDKVDHPKETSAGQRTVSFTNQDQLTKEDKRLIICLMWITYPPTYFSQGESQLFIFEDKEAAICKYHTLNDLFAVRKCTPNGNREKWWWIDTVWQQDENCYKKGKILKSGWNMIAWWQSMTRAPMTTSMIAWYCMTRTPWQHPWLRGTARCEHQRPLPLTPTWA